MATLTISITIPDDKVNEVRDDFCAALGYSDTISNPQTGEPMANPETKNAFIKRMVIEHMRRKIRIYREDRAIMEARNTTASDVDAIKLS